MAPQSASSARSHSVAPNAVNALLKLTRTARGKAEDRSTQGGACLLRTRHGTAFSQVQRVRQARMDGLGLFAGCGCTFTSFCGLQMSALRVTTSTHESCSTSPLPTGGWRVSMEPSCASPSFVCVWGSHTSSWLSGSRNVCMSCRCMVLHGAACLGLGAGLLQWGCPVCAVAGACREGGRCCEAWCGGRLGVALMLLHSSVGWLS